MRYFIGTDLGGTKTHTIIVDENGQVVGFGEAGPGNHQSVGYDGTSKTLHTALSQALQSSGLKQPDIAGAGFGIAGYDWPSQRPRMVEIIRELGITAPFALVNDTIPGLVAGSEEGWGVVVVSGTGCNCRGWDREHQREGRVTGYGVLMGEGAGATELVFRAMQLIGFEWTTRGPQTALSQVFTEYVNARDLEDLIEGYTAGYYAIDGKAAPLVFHVAEAGDCVATELVQWAGRELGDLAVGVIHQLQFEQLVFDVVLTGSMFEGGPLLIEPMRETIHRAAPGARLTRLTIPPVIGAAIIGMEQTGLKANSAVRQNLVESLSKLRQTSSQKTIL